MSMAWIRKNYGVPAKRGRYVEAYYRYGGRWVLAARGHIASASCYLHLKGGPTLHPTSGMVYFDQDGTVIADYRTTDSPETSSPATSES